MRRMHWMPLLWLAASACQKGDDGGEDVVDTDTTVTTETTDTDTTDTDTDTTDTDTTDTDTTDTDTTDTTDTATTDTDTTDTDTTDTDTTDTETDTDTTDTDTTDTQTTTDTDTTTPCTYPAGAVEPMTEGEVLTAYSWPDARHMDGVATADLDLTDVHCDTDDDIDWSPFDVLVFISIPAW